MMDKLRGAFHSVTMWVNGVFLALFPFADSLIQGIHDNLPDLSQYLPANVFKVLGVAVVVFNIYQRTRTTESLADKGAK